jgi:hypothetical protein
LVLLDYKVTSVFNIFVISENDENMRVENNRNQDGKNDERKKEGGYL